MCRATPSRVVRIEDDIAWVEQDGMELAVSILGVDNLAVGDYVFHHAGLALERLTPEDAAEVLAALDELERLMLLEGYP